MKKFNMRLISLILVVATIVTSAPFIAYAFNQTTGAATLTVIHDGEPIDKTLNLIGNERLTLEAEAKRLDSYQWQIFVPEHNMFVNITGMTKNTCDVSYSLIKATLDEFDRAALRLIGKKNDVSMSSPTIWISYKDNLDEDKEVSPDKEKPEDTAKNDNMAEAVEEVSFPAKLRSALTSFMLKFTMLFAADISIPPCNCGSSDPLSLHPSSCAKKSYVVTVLATGDYTADEIYQALKGTPVVDQYQIANTIGLTNASLANELSEIIKNASQALTTYTVTIKYQYNNEGPSQQGSVTANYVATLAKGTTFNEVITSPIRTGYKAYMALESDWNEEKGFWHYDVEESSLTPAEEVPVNISSINENHVIYVVYMPQLVPYTVTSYKQNIYNDFYTFHENKVYEGINGALVGSSVLSAQGGLHNIPGFTRLAYDDALVAADGSTVIELYYDREYRLMNFNLGSGGFGVEPVYARYGTSFRVIEPTRPGYIFDGWEVEYAYDGYDGDGDPIILELDNSAYTSEKKAELEKLNDSAVEIPEFDVMFRAKWTARNDITCTVVYWRQDTVGDTYSYWGKKELDATAGQTFNTNDEIGLAYPASTVDNDGEEGLDEYPYFTYNAEKTIAENGDTVTVNGAGSTVVNVYYTRNEYTIQYVYARASVSTSTKEFVPQSSIISGDTYYIRGNKTKNDLTTQIAPLTAWNQGKYAVSTTSQGSPLTIEHVSNNTYRIKTQEATPRYLSIGNNEAGWTTTESTVTIEFTGSTCTIGSKLNNTTYYMNDYGGSGQYAAGWSGKDSGSEWEICSAEESIATNLNVQICINTKYGYGLYPKNGIFYNLGDLGWTGNLGNNLPEITLPKDTDRFSNNNDYIEVSGYRYYYVTVTARYGANITDAWPQASIGNIDSYSFGSWGASAACKYREKSPEHANIIGPYPTMSAEMIEDPTNPIAQTMVAWWSGAQSIAKHTYYIYVEQYPGQDISGKKTITLKNDITYVLTETHEFSCAHNGNTRCDPIVYEGLTCISEGWAGAELSNRRTDGDYTVYDYYCSSPGEGENGYGTLYVHDNGYDSYYTLEGPSPDTPHYIYMKEADLQLVNGEYYLVNNYFFYERNRYDFSYYNRGSDKKPTGVVDALYNTPLSDKNVLKAEMEENYYPDELEKDAYYFDGWYLTSECHDGTEVNWETLTLPASDLEIYAKWVPVTHTVSFYETYTDYQSENPRHTLTVNHGDPAPYSSTISRDGYLFVGWFYFNGSSSEKVAFLPNNIPVNKDLKIYAEWQKEETLIKYTIKYKAWMGNKNAAGEYVLNECITEVDANGVPTKTGTDDEELAIEIGEPVTGQFQEGRTKTFTAKAIPQLYPEFQHRYFPLLSSHAIMFVREQDHAIDPHLDVIEHGDGTYELVYTFHYVYLSEVEYTVNYINTETDNNEFIVNELPVHVDSEVIKTPDAITTRRFKQINGYVPDEYQKQVILTAYAEDNVINFYYTRNSDPMFFIVHMVENLDGTWTEEKKEFGTGNIDSTITRSADPDDTYPGHHYDPNYGWDSETNTYNWVSAEGLPIDHYVGSGDLWAPDNNTVYESDLYVQDLDNAAGTVTAKLVMYNTVVIRFYYTLNEFGYRVEHKILENGDWVTGDRQTSTDNVTSFDPFVYTDTMRYGETFTGYSRNLLHLGYWVEGYEDGSIATYTRKISDDEDTNVITIWYVDSPVEINYIMVVDDIIPSNTDEMKGNSLSITLSSTKSHSKPTTITGSQPNVAYGFRFEGWYTDANCKTPVPDDWLEEGNRLQPQKNATVLHTANYYAHFVPLYESLNIYKEGVLPEDKDRFFLFRITGDPSSEYTRDIDITVTVQGNGNAVIADLPLGSYTVTEIASWSWDYEAEGTEKIIQVKVIDPYSNPENKLVFTNSKEATKYWLTDEGSADNIFEDL
ncbi:MAG: InlB B-repeat-containing protein [Clostridia bacterium]|nr:InlB B-repeat-containing protein [Clostridia bacterium]